MDQYHILQGLACNWVVARATIAMTFRTLAAVFFFAYGSIIPIAASEFLVRNLVATLAMMASCFVIAALLLSGRAVLLNILLAFYLLRVYLTRPYIDVFLPNLDGKQVEYIVDNNYFFNSADAAVVYLSLLSLLLAWFFGLIVAQPKQIRQISPPWIFRQVDSIVMSGNWRFWLVWVLLSILNYKSANELWQGIATGEGSNLFAYGMLSTATINYVCLYAFLRPYPHNATHPSKMLFIPVLLSGVFSMAGGSRSFVLFSIILFLSYWFVLNYRRHINRYDVSRIIILAIIISFAIFSGLLAQLIRPLLRGGADLLSIQETLLDGLDIFNSDNPLHDMIFFGISELLHRLSSLQAQFMILNDHFVHVPWETYNPIESVMRIVNDLLPGDVFDNVLSINQLYNYIYHLLLLLNF